MARSVDDYLQAHSDWSELLEGLRAILLDSGLEETIKWGAPVYVLDGKNVVGLGAFKSYAGLWFFDGAFLSDPEQVLINAQEGKTRALRQWRFQPGQRPDSAQVRRYVEEAIVNARAGRSLKPRAGENVDLPPILEQALAQDESLRAAFEALTPGRQRDYARYLGEAKRADTRQRRLDRVLPLIRRGEGLNDRYSKN